MAAGIIVYRITVLIFSDSTLAAEAFRQLLNPSRVTLGNVTPLNLGGLFFSISVDNSTPGSIGRDCETMLGLKN